MVRQRLWLSCAAVFVLFFGYDYLFHNLLLKDAYTYTASLWRSPVEISSNVVWIIMSQIIVAIVFGYLFSKGYEKQGVSEGVRFGLLMGLLMSAPGLASYAIQPIPLYLVGARVMGTLFEFVLAGIVVALVYRTEEERSERPEGRVPSTTEEKRRVA